MTRQQKDLEIRDIEKVIASMTDAKKVEEIKQRFYLESAMGTIRQILKTYPEGKSEDRALSFIMEMADKELIDADEFLEMTIDLLLCKLEEGEEHEDRR